MAEIPRPPRQQAERDAQLADIRKRYAETTRALELVDIVGAEADRPLWQQILKPFLEKEVAGFREAALSMPREDFERAQARAALARDLLADVDGKADPALRLALIKEAERLDKILTEHRE